MRKFGTSGILFLTLFLFTALSSRPLAAQSCTNIAGKWTVTETGELSQTLSAEGQSSSQVSPFTVSSTVTFTQSGCSIQLTANPAAGELLGTTAALARTGTVSGNTVTLTGQAASASELVAAAAEGTGATITSVNVSTNVINATGQVSGSTLTMNETGTLSATGGFTDQGQSGTYSYSYSPSSSATFTMVPVLQIPGGGQVTLPAGTVSSVYSQTLSAANGTPPYSWSLLSGSLPAGLSLSSSGTLSGTPTKSGTSQFTAQVTDATGASASSAYSITIAPPPLSVTTGSTLPSGTTGVQYTAPALSATGGTPPYTFALATGSSLPSGLTLSAGGAISGTPATAGTFRFSVIATDSGLPAQTATATFSIAVVAGLQIPGGGGAAQITLPAGKVSTAYSQTLSAVNGKAPYSWSVLGGSLPQGLSLSGAGVVSGVPTRPGGALFTVRATDSTGEFTSSMYTLTITPLPVSITTTSLPSGYVGTPYPEVILSASGGTPPYTFQLGSVPAGLTFASGAISGTPGASGTFTIPVSVMDSSSPAQTSSVQLSLVVSAAATNLELSQNSAAFSLVTGASALPPPITVNVQSTSVSQPTGYTVAVTPTVSWLSVQSGSTTPGSVTLGLTQQALSLSATTQTSVVVSCAQGTSCAGKSQTINVSLNISNPQPQLVVTTPSLSFNASSANPQPVTQSLGLQNSGGGKITINTVTSPDSFVSIAGNPGSLEGGPPSYLTVTVNPSGLAAGFHESSITATTTSGTVNVPLDILVSANPTMTLEPAGSVFSAVTGSLPGNVRGSFEVSVTGTSSVSFTAAELPGANWLTLNTTAVNSTGANPGVVSFTINSAAASLQPGAYYGAIQVSSASANESPETYIVVLNVVSSVAALTPNPQPAGLLFIASSGTPPSQTVNLYAGSSTAQAYQAASDSSFISVSPATGTTSSGSPAATTVSVNLQGLSAGVYTGGVSYAFASEAVPAVNVTLIVEPAAVAAAYRSGPKPLASASCTPSHLVPVENGLVNSFSQPLGWPAQLSILLTNDCGQPVTNAQVVATFNDGEPPLGLAAEDTTTGTYGATWTPRSQVQQTAVTITASAPNFPVATAQISGQVSPNVAPIINPGGVLNAFAIAPEPGVPFAPGSIIQIYGSDLASQTASGGTIPLPAAINQTSVIVGGIQAPLYYVSPTQINAQIPFELASNRTYDLLVNANNAYTTSYPIQLASDSPGIAQAYNGIAYAQHPDYSLVTETAPAKPGEYLTMYLAGMGLTNQTVPSGTASPSASLANVLDAPKVTVNGAAVTNLVFAGLTPTAVALYQVNFQVPAAAPDGDLPVVVTQASGVTASTVLPVHN